MATYNQRYRPSPLGCITTILVGVGIVILYLWLCNIEVIPKVYFHPDLASVNDFCIASCTADELITYGPTEEVSEDNQTRRDRSLAKALCILHYSAIKNYLTSDTLFPLKIKLFEDSDILHSNLDTKHLRARGDFVSASDQLLLVHPNDIKKCRNLFFFMNSDAALLVHSEFSFLIRSEGTRVFWRAVVTSKVYLVNNLGRVLWGTYNLKGVSSKIRASKGIDLFVLQWSELSEPQIMMILREATLNSARNLASEIRTDICYLLQPNVKKPDGIQERKRLFGFRIPE